MATRHLYIARHGEADPFGELTDTGRRQAGLLGARLTSVPIDAVWHSPLARAAATGHEVARHLRPGTAVAEAAELIDHVPYVPTAAEAPAPWIPFFDGYSTDEAEAGHRVAQSLISRFATDPDRARTGRDTHEVLITHSYPIAWLVRHALDAPAVRWLGLNSANTGLTVIEYRPDQPPTLIMFNEMTHLPADLRWTGFPDVPRP